MRMFQAMGYPRGFFNRHAERRPKPATPGEEVTRWRSLPYIGNVSERTTRMLRPFGKRIAYCATNTIRSVLMRPKDPLPTVQKANVVYRFPCAYFPSHYVGGTSKTMRTRVKEHRQAVGRLDHKWLVFAHAADRNHAFRYEDAEVISVDARKGRGKLIREAWYSSPASLNRHITLRPAYKAIRLREQSRANPGDDAPTQRQT